jgi:pseudouridine-5'-phosphate glycosidase
VYAVDRYCFTPEVAAAIKRAQPVVALESTIISHGFPYPENLEMAQSVEAIIREEGAVPATIALLDGKIHIGLTEDALYRVATDPDVVKTSIRDLGKVLAMRKVGATTVASTVFVANQVGIRFFATGGIGGVHRGASSTFDISADLQVLAKCNVCVVCSGVKSILDIPATLEYLETLGVPVYGYETDRFPAFYTRDSGMAVESINIRELVDILRIQEELGLNHSVIVAVPIPKEVEMEPSRIEHTIQTALAEADQNGIRGKEVTPYLLAAVHAATQGKSVRANLGLIQENARIAARIARVYHK